MRGPWNRSSRGSNARLRVPDFAIPRLIVYAATSAVISVVLSRESRSATEAAVIATAITHSSVARNSLVRKNGLVSIGPRFIRIPPPP